MLLHLEPRASQSCCLGPRLWPLTSHFELTSLIRIQGQWGQAQAAWLGWALEGRNLWDPCSVFAFVAEEGPDIVLTLVPAHGPQDS